VIFFFLYQNLEGKELLLFPLEAKVIFTFQAVSKEKELKKKYILIDGYFYQKRSRDPPGIIFLD